MALAQLIIGNQNYSSWSLRVWIILQKMQITFETIKIPLFVEGFSDAVLQYSPTAKVPAFIVGDLQLWDSYAIMEYIAETHSQLWPEASELRAFARAISAEMHSGFFNIRSYMPMNCRARHRIIDLADDLADEIQRVQAIWQQCQGYKVKNNLQGAWLLGEFTIVDAMYIPLALRFNSYSIECNSHAKAYIQHVLSDTDMKIWFAAAEEEKQVIDIAEVGQS